MQISSRTQDFLIDTLVLREELSILNNVFTNPKVLKVFFQLFSFLDHEISFYKGLSWC